MANASELIVATPKPAEMREKIFALEREILRHPQIDIPVEHFFAPGVYMRQITLPEGAIVTGAIHKTEHLNILSQGEISVWTDEGVKRLTASCVIKSQPGIKRVGYAHKKSVWITVHSNVTDERDVEKIKATLTTNSYEEFLDYVKAQEPKLLSQRGQ